jgi:curli biogenesis system outer membrane secretion channel CsgG
MNYLNTTILNFTSLILLGVSVIGCSTTETFQAVTPPTVMAMVPPNVNVEKVKVSIGNFDNRSSYMRGIFSDNTDRLGGQARSILETHLQQSGYFNVLNRDNMAALKQEATYTGSYQNIKGAKYVLTGDISEFGRKEVGDQQLFGIMGRGKSQIAYAKVNLNVVNVTTSEIVHSVQGAGEYSLSEREVLGFGSNASYDSTLNGKVLDLAIREAVQNLSMAVTTGKVSP